MSKATKIHFFILYALLALLILWTVVFDGAVYITQENMFQAVRQHSVILHDNNLGTTK